MPDETLRFIRVQQDELDPGPLPVPFHDSTMGPFTHWKLGWLRLTADDGRVGQAPGGVPAGVCDVLLGEGPRTVEEWWRRIWWMQRNDGHRSPATSGLLCALDAAMRDILAQRAGQPWHRFMGATRDRVPVYGSGGPTTATV
jgi:L-alanine-DL-glutamate epimerase-like enolase superfamily enzyme